MFGYVVNVVGELGTLFDVSIRGWLAELSWVELSSVGMMCGQCRYAFWHP